MASSEICFFQNEARPLNANILYNAATLRGNIWHEIKMIWIKNRHRMNTKRVKRKLVKTGKDVSFQDLLQ